MSHYDDQLTRLAVDMINTYDVMAHEPEALRKPDDLHRFLSEHHMQSDRSIGEAELAAVRDLRQQLRSIIETDDEAFAAATLNRLLSDTSVRLQLTSHKQQAWHVTWMPKTSTSAIQYLAFQATLGLAFALERYGKERLRVCRAAPCREVFVDMSRNRSRRYCSEGCANRHNIAAYRQRQRSAQED